MPTSMVSARPTPTPPTITRICCSPAIRHRRTSEDLWQVGPGPRCSACGDISLARSTPHQDHPRAPLQPYLATATAEARTCAAQNIEALLFSIFLMAVVASSEDRMHHRPWLFQGIGDPEVFQRRPIEGSHEDGLPEDARPDHVAGAGHLLGTRPRVTRSDPPVFFGNPTTNLKICHVRYPRRVDTTAMRLGFSMASSSASPRRWASIATARSSASARSRRR